jgi:hypothetical protein
MYGSLFSILLSHCTILTISQLLESPPEFPPLPWLEDEFVDDSPPLHCLGRLVGVDFGNDHDVDDFTLEELLVSLASLHFVKTISDLYSQFRMLQSKNDSTVESLKMIVSGRWSVLLSISL